MLPEAQATTPTVCGGGATLRSLLYTGRLTTAVVCSRAKDQMQQGPPMAGLVL